MRFDLRWLWLGLLPFIVYSIFFRVFEELRPSGLVFPLAKNPDSLTIGAAEAYRRYFWLSAFAVAGAVAAAVTFSAIMTMRRGLVQGNRAAIYGVALVAIAIMAVVEIFSGAKRWYTHLGDGLFQSVFGTGKAFGELSRLEVLDAGLDVIKWLGMIALILLTLCLVLTLARPASADMPDEEYAQHLAAAAKTQRALLLHLTAVYVVAIVAMFAWMMWPMPYLADEAAKAAYRDVVNGAAILQAVGYSLGTAAIYLPAAMVLRQRAMTLAGRMAGQTDAGLTGANADDWLARMGLAASPVDQFRQTATLALPVLVSLAPAVGDLLGTAVK